MPSSGSVPVIAISRPDPADEGRSAGRTACRDEQQDCAVAEEAEAQHDADQRPLQEQVGAAGEEPCDQHRQHDAHAGTSPVGRGGASSG